MRIDSLADAKAHLRSMAGENVIIEDYGGGEAVAKVPTKESIRQVEMARREADEMSKRENRPITVDLPDYVYEEKYKMSLGEDGYFKLYVRTSGGWSSVNTMGRQAGDIGTLRGV